MAAGLLQELRTSQKIPQVVIRISETHCELYYNDIIHIFMKYKHLLLAIITTLLCINTYAQIDVRFEDRDGNTYAVITNYGDYMVQVSCRCIDPSGLYRDGIFNIMAGCEQLVGPNFQWYWRQGAQFLYRYANTQYSISFKSTHGDATPPDSQTDGYIYQGRNVKYQGQTYKLYKKRGHYYIYDKRDGWIKIQV